MRAPYDNVAQSSTTGGTSDLLLTSSVTGRRDFTDVFSDGDTMTVHIANGAEWEITLATYNLSADSVSRAATPFASSNGGSKTNFTAGEQATIAVCVSVEDVFITSAILSPAQITANQDDYAPTGVGQASWLRLDTDASRTLTGLSAGRPGEIKTITNIGSNDLVLSHQDASSTAANRFLSYSGADVTVGADESVNIRYDDNTERWRVVKLPGASGGGSSASHGQCILEYVSGTQIKLLPRNGDKLFIAGTQYSIPSAGVTLANTGLSASTLYYIYAYMSGGTMTLEASATARATDTTAGNVGVEIKTGDNSRTLVGMVYTDGSTPGQFLDAAGTRYVRSWFNDQGVAGSVVAGTPTTASATMVNLTGVVLYQLCWAGETVQATFEAYGSSSTSQDGYLQSLITDGTGSTNGGLAANTGTGIWSMGASTCVRNITADEVATITGQGRRGAGGTVSYYAPGLTASSKGNK